MPRYHFDLIDSKTIADEGGAEAPDDVTAMDIGDAIVRRLRQEHPELNHQHLAILITNEDGEEVCRIPLDVIH